jgi:hypothetical protein
MAYNRNARMNWGRSTTMNALMGAAQNDEELPPPEQPPDTSTGGGGTGVQPPWDGLPPVSWPTPRNPPPQGGPAEMAEPNPWGPQTPPQQGGPTPWNPAEHGYTEIAPGEWRSPNNQALPFSRPDRPLSPGMKMKETGVVRGMLPPNWSSMTDEQKRDWVRANRVGVPESPPPWGGMKSRGGSGQAPNGFNPAM